MLVGHLVVVCVRNSDGMTQPCCNDMGREALTTHPKIGQQSAHLNYPATLDSFRSCLKVIDTFRSDRSSAPWRRAQRDQESGSHPGGVPLGMASAAASGAKLPPRMAPPAAGAAGPNARPKSRENTNERLQFEIPAQAGGLLQPHAG